jgi:3-methyladenine DNA glycosylase AlkD
MIEKIEVDMRRFLKNNSDKKVVEKYAKYFKEGYDPYGVAWETLNPKIDEWFKICQEKLDQKQFWSLCEHLMNSGKYEEVSIVYHFLLRLRSKYNRNLFKTLSSWLEKYVNNWAHCDSFSRDILYQFLIDEVIGFKDLYAWVDSPFRWKRRAVAVTLVRNLEKGGSVPQAMQVAQKLILDPERVVQQGVGWLLREAWKKSPEKVEDFLLKWKDQAPRLIIQYATEKIDKEKRKKFRRSE